MGPAPEPALGGALLGVIVLGAAAVRTLPPRQAAIIAVSGPALLTEAVRAASAGDALISPSITVRLLKQLAPAHSRAAAGARNQLSERELDIARGIARGRTNQEIAAELFISLSTVKTHIARIQGKLGVRNRVEIAAWSWENRIMDHAGHRAGLGD
jgi:DNA-binding NarL/FixJ family response regulator